MKTLVKNTENAIKAFFSANIFLSFFTANLLQYLWGMINTLQVIVLTDLFGFQEIPQNAEMLMQAILRMCSLEFVDTSFLLEGLFNFRETKAFWTKVTSSGFEFSRFADAGYETAIFFELLGPILIIVIVFVILQLVKLITKYIMVKFTNDSPWKRKLL